MYFSLFFIYIFQGLVQNKPIVLKGCFLTCVYLFSSFFSSGKIHYSEIFDMLSNIDPPLIFATCRGPDVLYIYIFIHISSYSSE